jgi:S1-C subfamily serine protease
MNIRNLTALAGGLVMAAALAAPASAQIDDVLSQRQSELYCVYDVLAQSGDLGDFTDAIIDAGGADDVERAVGYLDDAVQECVKAYDWSAEVEDFATTVGIHGAIVEALTGRLIDAGLKEEEVAAIFDVLDLLDEDDMNKFASSEWVEDRRFQKRMNRELISAGVPNKADVLDTSMQVIESSVLAARAIVDWIAFEPSKPEPAAPRTASSSSTNKKKSKTPNATPREPKMEMTGSGTGFYVTADGFMITNAHVVEGCTRVRLKDGADLDILAVEVDEDLALLKQSGAFQPLILRDGRGVRLAEDVLIAGYPLGGILSSGINVTTGEVSAEMGLGDDTRRFQFTAPVQQGNSGGPVLDTSGHVIGVVVSKLNAMNIQSQYGDIPQNVNFGITLARLTAFLNDHDVKYVRQPSGNRMDKVDLAEIARASTVLLQCFQ